jgi:hypothetical protein
VLVELGKTAGEDSGRHDLTHDHPTLVEAVILAREDVLHLVLIAARLVPQHLGDVGDLSRSVLQA